jgi:hypothetical protein
MYSPTVYGMEKRPRSVFCYNADRQIPPHRKTPNDWDERVHFADYDSEGYDSYGYSAFLENGEYIGDGQGVDRDGYTEHDYKKMYAD